MTTIWRIWVTLTLLYLLLSRGHGGPGIVNSAVTVYRWGEAIGHISDEVRTAHAQDIVITPCNLSGGCRD